MFRFDQSNSNCASKDAHTCAPSVSCAKKSYNVALITGIAMAVSVFLYAIISIISGIIIMCELNVIIIPVIMFFVINIIMICAKNLKLNMYAKLYAR